MRKNGNKRTIITNIDSDVDITYLPFYMAYCL